MMNFPIALVYSAFASVLFLGSLNLNLRVIDKVRFNAITATLIGVFLNVLGGVLHEAAHAAVAYLWGLEVVWGGTYTGLSIRTIPTIYNTPPIVQTTVVLAGPLLSALIVVVLWKIIDNTTDTATKVVASYLLFIQGLGGLGSILIPFSGDCRNFAQGLGKITGLPAGTFGIGLTILLIVWVYILKNKFTAVYAQILKAK